MPRLAAATRTRTQEKVSAQVAAFEIENAELVIVGRMGVWDARTHIDAADFLRLFAKLFLSPAVLFYALKAPFLLLRRKSGGSA